MELPKHFISCDWGTTNFRLRVVETKSLRVLAGRSTNQGIKTLYDKFQSSECQSGQQGQQEEFFCDYLKKGLKMLPKEYQKYLIIISGMASSNIGLYELEYSGHPFNGSGKDLNWKIIPFRKDQDILLISGVKSANGMMRGEEIQAIGLSEQLEPYESGTLILPGTHSKHLTYKRGSFIDLKSFMTGEIFELFSKKSILTNSIVNTKWGETREEVFKKGLSIGFSKELSSELFSIRAGYLNGTTTKEDNYYYLSGMLIGDELAYLKNAQNKVFLLASEPVFTLYKIALEAIIKPDQLVTFDENILEKRLLTGHKKILKHYVA